MPVGHHLRVTLPHGYPGLTHLPHWGHLTNMPPIVGTDAPSLGLAA